MGGRRRDLSSAGGVCYHDSRFYKSPRLVFRASRGSAMDESPDQRAGKFQVRLLDLIVVVVGVSYVLDVARRSRVAWGGGLPDFAHAAGLTALSFGVCVGLVVAGQWVGRLRQREGRTWALIWRVVAAAWLAGALVEVAGALQDTAVATPMFGSRTPLRLRLATLMASLGMVGVILAASPLRTRTARTTPRPRLGSWPSVAFAAVVGVVIVGIGNGLIPYLVLLAIEFVWNAMRRAPFVPRPIVFDRLTTAGLEALPGLVGCLATAVWIDDDLRAAVRDPLDARTPRSWGGMIARAATVALAALGSAYVLFVSMPKLDPWMSEGLAAAVPPSLIATILLGFAALAAGLSARAAAHLTSGAAPGDRPDGRESPKRGLGPWPRRLIGGVIALVCLEITASAVQAILRDLELRWYIPLSLENWMSIIRVPAGWFGNSAVASGWGVPVDHLDDLVIGTAAIWLTIRMVALIAPGSSGKTSALDAIAADRLALGRYFGWWIGLTTMMLASLPILAILGVTLIHFVVRWVAN